MDKKLLFTKLEEKKLSYYLEKSRNLLPEKFDKKLKIAILNSFTINGLEETLRVKCADEEIQCISYVGGYNQYIQEILEFFFATRLYCVSASEVPRRTNADLCGFLEADPGCCDRRLYGFSRHEKVAHCRY